jgi:hypothetical protein
VQVSRVDLDGRKIDFRWVQEDGSLLDKPLRGKELPAAKTGRSKSRGAKQTLPTTTATKSAHTKTKAAAKKNTTQAKQKTKNRH